MNKDPSYRKKVVPTTKGKIAYAVVWINGKDIYLGKWNSPESKREYDRVVGEWKAAGRISGKADEPISVTEICLDYTLEMKKRYLDPNGNPTEEFKTVQRIMKSLRATYGRTPAEEFKALRFKAFREQLIDTGISRYVVNKYCRHVIRAFKLAAENEKLPAENYQTMKAVETLKKGRTNARETDAIKPVPVDVIERTIQHTHGIVADMVRLQLLTGMRPGEVCQLRPGDIDRSDEIWVFTPERHKNLHRDQSRAICLGQRAQQLLAPYLLRAADKYCFDPAEAIEQVRRRRNLERKTPAHQGNYRGSKKSRRKPLRQAGDCYTTSSYRRAIHRACDAANLDRWSPNRIRKTAATLIRKETGNLEAAQAVLGHKSKSTTERFYAEIDLSLAATVMRAIG